MLEEFSAISSIFLDRNTHFPQPLGRAAPSIPKGKAVIRMAVVHGTSPDTRKRNELLDRKIKAENELRLVDAELWRMDNNMPLQENTPDKASHFLPVDWFTLMYWVFILWLIYAAFTGKL